MRVGLTFDLRNPPQWFRPWNYVYGHALEAVAEAERLGADSIWTTEHHFFEDGYLPQPLTFCAAAAARTSRVRLGTAIMIAPLRAATQIAEESAVVDLISDGRLDLGLGPGYRVPEFEAFGADIGSRFSATFDLTGEVRRLLGSGTVTPPPVQHPLPIWLGYRQVVGAYRTGLMGEGLLRMDPGLLRPYLDGLAAGGHDPSRARMAGSLGLVIADDPEAVWPRVRPHLSYMWNSYHAYSVEGTGQQPPGPIDPERWRRSVKGHLPRFQVLTPDDAVHFVGEAVGALPVADLSVWASIAGMDESIAHRHQHLWLTEVRPKISQLGLQA
jgi:alkanesulfonate monooxygenase SsuD/methylene tetrahydromethanopterin reductase-like flavin-dependent oxidoreductase (luciferase family)